MTATLVPGDSHDSQLLSHVRPSDWVNPTPAPRYNLVVIGAGTAGLVTAAGAAGLGAKVALIERDLMGGDCLNVGCVPSKALLRSAKAMAQVRDAGQFGVRVLGGSDVDFPEAMRRLRRLRADISPHDSASRFRDLGVDVFLGEGHFTGPDTVAVAGQTLRFKKAVLATGARASHPAITGLAEAGFLTNESVFALTELPRRLAILGAGPIGCELAQAFARLGSQVTLIGTQPQILPREDMDAADRVAQSLTRNGVRFVLGGTTTRVECLAGEKVLHVQTSSERTTHTVDAILVATGRTPNVDGLNLEAAGVAFDPREGVHVNDRLRTSNSRIFAAGDVCSRFKFTHAADALARIAIQNSLFWGRAKASSLTIPWCTYTDPEIAHVGLSEADAKRQNVSHRVFIQELAKVDRAILDGETKGFVKIIASSKSDTILGATIVATHAGDMISEVSLAMTNGLGLKAFARTIHPYPTQAEALKKIGDTFNRTRLTPWVKKLFATWLKWTR